MWRAYKTLYNTSQRDEEDLKTYYNHFKNQVEVIENYGGKIGTENAMYEHDEAVKNLTEVQKQMDSNIEVAKEWTREKFLGYGLLANCDKKRYGNVLEDIDNNLLLVKLNIHQYNRRHMNI